MSYVEGFCKIIDMFDIGYIHVVSNMFGFGALLPYEKMILFSFVTLMIEVSGYLSLCPISLGFLFSIKAGIPSEQLEQSPTGM